MSWRPEEWKDLLSPHKDWGGESYNSGMEAGADAILEALKNEGTPMGMKNTAYANERKGYLVFIPDESVK